MNFDPNVFISALNFELFNRIYDQFLSLFPVSTQWLVSAIVLISIIAAFFMLVRFNWLFIIVIIILFPVTVPIIREFFGGIYQFVIHLLEAIQNGLPKT